MGEEADSARAAPGKLHLAVNLLGGLILLLWKPRQMKGQEDRGGKSHQSPLVEQNEKGDLCFVTPLFLLWKKFPFCVPDAG